MITVSNYKEHPILIIVDDSNPAVKLMFGVSKARLLVRNMKEIEEFVAHYGKSI